jgi:hypothetical protein
MNLHLHTDELQSGDRFDTLNEPLKGIMWAPIPLGMWDVVRSS